MSAFKLSKAFWSQQRVFLTGAGGFLGSHTKEALQALKPKALIAPRSNECNLLNPAQVKRLLKTQKPTMVIHLAAVCGGIGANQKAPGKFFYDNAMMGISLMEQSRLHGVQKFVQVGTVCAYPKFPPRIPFREEDLWTGYPEETNAPYGLAKKMLLVQAQAYRQQYGFDAIYLLPANLYGPRDHFDFENSHVIPALIRKIEDAQKAGSDILEVWGTGKPTREFLYVKDAVQGILLAAEHYSSGEPVNLGSRQSVSICHLTELLCRLMKFRGRLLWNTGRPDGQPKRALDNRHAWNAFGYRAAVPLKRGLKETIRWYREHLARV